MLGRYITISVLNGREEYHWHDLIEIICVLRGTMRARLNNRDYDLHENEVILFNCDDVHNLEKTSEDLLYLRLHINIYAFNQYIPGISNILFKCTPDMYDEKTSRFIDEIRSRVARISLYADSEQIGEQKVIYETVFLLNLLKTVFNAMGRAPKDYKSEEQFDRIWDAVEYIYVNHARKLTLTEVARQVHVSEAYLSHLLKESMGNNFEELLNVARCEHALQLLLTTKLSLSQIAYESGFSAPRYMNAYFKKVYGSAPSDYQKEHKQKTKESAPSGEHAQIFAVSDEMQLCKAKLRSYMGDGFGSVNNLKPENLIELSFISHFDSSIRIGPLSGTIRMDASALLRADMQELLLEAVRKIGYNKVEIFGVRCLRNLDGKINRSHIRYILDFLHRNHLSFSFVLDQKELRLQKELDDIEKNLVIIPACDQEEIKLPDLLVDEQKLPQTAHIGSCLMRLVMKGEPQGIKILANMVTLHESFDSGRGGFQMALYTEKNIKTPLFFALEMIAAMGDELFPIARGVWAARKETSFRVLLAWPYDLSDTEDDLNISLSFKDLDRDKTYLIKKIRLDRMHGSIFESYCDAEALELLNCDEIERIKSVCLPQMTYKTIKQTASFDETETLNSSALVLMAIEEVAS